MRIAILSSGLGHTARGIEAWAKSLAESLHREGEDVMLFHGGGSYTCPNIKLNYLHRDTLPIRLLTRLAPRFTWRWGLTSRYGLEQRLFTRAFLRWLRRHPEERPDIIHTQDYVVAKRLVRALGGIETTKLATRLATKVYWSSVCGLRSAHPSLITQHPLPLVFSNVTDESPVTLAGLPYLQHVTQPDYDAALATPTLADAKHFLIPNFVETTRFTPACPEPVEQATPDQKAAQRRKLGIPEDAFVIGCVAALQRHHKRLDALIDEVATLSLVLHSFSDEGSSLCAPASLREPSHLRPPTSAHRPPASVHLLLAGATTDDTPTIERYARDKLGSHVTILKDQPFDTMPAIYQCMDLYVHPAPDEVFGICLLEAMASGIPVIAHNSPRLKYVVGEGGWLTDVTQPGFLKSLWQQLQTELPAASPRCRQHVQTHFSWPAVYPQYMAMYREVVG